MGSLSLALLIAPEFVLDLSSRRRAKRNGLTGTRVGAERAASIGSGITACSLHRCQAPLQQHGTSVMGLLDNVLGSSVPGGSLAKPLGIALLAYLASRSGNNPAGSGGGLGG